MIIFAGSRDSTCERSEVQLFAIRYFVRNNPYPTSTPPYPFRARWTPSPTARGAAERGRGRPSRAGTALPARPAGVSELSACPLARLPACPQRELSTGLPEMRQKRNTWGATRDSRVALVQEGDHMPGSLAVLRDSHRTEVERLLTRAVEEEVRRSGGRTDGGVLLEPRAGLAGRDGGDRGRGVRRVCARAGRGGRRQQTALGDAGARAAVGTPALAAAVAAVAGLRRGSHLRHLGGHGAGRGRDRGGGGRGGGRPQAHRGATGRPPTDRRRCATSPAGPSSCGCSG